MRGTLLVLALLGAHPAIAQEPPSALTPGPAAPTLTAHGLEPQLQLGRSNFSLPVIDYQTPDGKWKRSSGMIIGHDVSPNATVGIGFFKTKPKYEDSTFSTGPTNGKSKKVSVGFSLRF